MNRKIMACLLKIYAIPINFVLKRSNEKHQKLLKCEFFKQLYIGEQYGVMSFFPKKLDDIKIKGTNQNFEDIAIVIQGPLVEKDAFTVNTVRMYRQYYDNVKIVVSTWVDANREIVEELEKIGVHVVLNPYPEYNGYGNINYQLVSSLSGIKKAKELEVKYIVKTRADQRLYNPCSLSLLLGVYRTDRVVMLGGIANSFYSREFYISDFMTFGSTEDMELLYNCNLCEENTAKMLEQNKQQKRFEYFAELISQAEKNCNITIPAEYADAVEEYACAESMIAYTFFQKKCPFAKELTPEESYDEFLKNYTVLVDADSLGFYWFKYDFQVTRQNWFDRPGKLDLGKWFSIMQKKKKQEIKA